MHIERPSCEYLLLGEEPAVREQQLNASQIRIEPSKADLGFAVSTADQSPHVLILAAGAQAVILGLAPCGSLPGLTLIEGSLINISTPICLRNAVILGAVPWQLPLS